MNKEELEALERILDYANMSEARITNAVYISPGQRLRMEADQLDQRERDFWTLQDYWQKEKQRLERSI